MSGLLTRSFLALALLLCACESMDRGEQIGTLGGAVAGGLLGSQFGSGEGRVLAAVGGTLAGAYLGNRLGQRFGERDQQVAAGAEQRALAGNQPTRWRNPETGTEGAVTPMRTYTDRSGKPCREYEHTVNVDGRRESAVGTACRNENGEWVLVAS